MLTVRVPDLVLKWNSKRCVVAYDLAGSMQAPRCGPLKLQQLNRQHLSKKDRSDILGLLETISRHFLIMLLREADVMELSKSRSTEPYHRLIDAVGNALLSTAEPLGTLE